MTLVYICTRCHRVPCECEDPNAGDPNYCTLEIERPAFEAFMRTHYPERSLERWGHTYKDDKTRNRWVGWQGRARSGARLIARRA